MKRKSVLSCLAALLGVFLATGVFAQPWVASPNVPTTPIASPGAPGYAASDTLFVCMPRIGNINLGYDVLGAYVPLTNGNWERVYPGAPVSSTNIFPMSGVTEGQTYIFKYTVTQSSCDLQVGDWLYAFVVAVPDWHNLSKDTTVCVSTTPLTINAAKLNASFSANIQKFLTEWNVTATPTGTPFSFDISTTGTKSDTAEYAFTGLSAKYTCPEPPFNYYYNVHVTDSIGQIPPKNTELCKDELPSRVNEWPWTYFGVTVSGTWSASPAQGLNGGKIDYAWLETQAVGTEITYTLNYNMSCNISAPGTFIGKIKVIDRPAVSPGTPPGADRGQDSAAFCKEAPYTVYTLKDYVTKVGSPFPVPSYWKFLGNTAAGGGSSLSPFTDGTPKGLTTENSDADEFEFQTGIPYYFRYTLDPTSPYCWAGDSGLLKVSFSLATGGTNIDERAEICQRDSSDFDMNAYMGLPGSTVWSPVPAGATVVNGVFKQPQALGNYIFPYNVPAVAGSCGGATSGKLYVKVTNNIHVTDVSIYYCVDIAPASVNLFSLLGIAPVAGESPNDGWASTYLGYLTTATGELDLANLRIVEYPGNSTFEFTFTPDPLTSACVNNQVRVTILLGSTMP